MRNDVSRLHRGKRYLLKRRAAAVDKLLGSFGSALWETYRRAGFDPRSQLVLPSLLPKHVLLELQGWGPERGTEITPWELLEILRRSPWIAIETGGPFGRNDLHIRLRATEDRKRLSKTPFANSESTHSDFDLARSLTS